MPNKRPPVSVETTRDGYTVWMQTSHRESLPYYHESKVENGKDYLTLTTRNLGETENLIVELQRIINYIEQNKMRKQWLKDINSVLPPPSSTK